MAAELFIASTTKVRSWKMTLTMLADGGSPEVSGEEIATYITGDVQSVLRSEDLCTYYLKVNM